MTMTPIHRIPRTSDASIEMIVEAESRMLKPGMRISDAFIDAIDTRPEADSHNAIMMDWAAQLRMELGIDWASCLRIAAIMYFG